MPLKLIGSALGVLLVIVIGLPLVTGASATTGGCTDDSSITRALITTRTTESSGRYDLSPGSGGASGAYQYLGSTWRRWAVEVGVDVRRYPEAYLAPAAVQDAVATANVRAIVGDTNDFTRIPVAWYWPRALTHPEDLDVVPAPQAGNTLTVRAYRDLWLRLFNDEAPSDTCNQPGQYALPIDRTLIDRDPSMLHRAHHDYPAIDLPVPVGTPVHAIAGGTVDAVSLVIGNCWPGPCDEPCGIGVTIVAPNRARWTYCHASALRVAVGQEVRAGQLILSSGNSGRSTGPHVHVGIIVDGRRRCPQALLVSIYEGRRANDLSSLAMTGCTAH